ncbi:MAG: hypothetical protein EBS47_10905 [Betaproteobacteria bacterium]|nr:hypothetical protein [Betaproteobacteria bacterium]NBU50571.1 hypothetical protein [Betaproteobacteria bacterium]
MSTDARVLIAISEFVEPRDFGEIVISIGERVLARKSNVPLCGADPDLVLAFVRRSAAEIRALRGNSGVVFENVDEVLQEKILRALA